MGNSEQLCAYRLNRYLKREKTMRTIRFVSILILTALSTLLYAKDVFEVTGSTTDTGTPIEV